MMRTVVVRNVRDNRVCKVRVTRIASALRAMRAVLIGANSKLGHGGAGGA